MTRNQLAPDPVRSARIIRRAAIKSDHLTVVDVDVHADILTQSLEVFRVETHCLKHQCDGSFIDQSQEQVEDASVTGTQVVRFLESPFLSAQPTIGTSDVGWGCG